MKVLFVGNSHTYFNDMPELFARFAAETTGEKPEVVMLAYSGRSLEWHRKEYFSLRFNLLYGNYDYCIIQQAAHPYPPVESTLEYGKEIIDLCHRNNTVPVVYMTWAEKRCPENQQIMIDTCEKLAKENNALLAPIGRVWQKVRQEHNDIELFYKDGEHAGPYGDFLIAAVLCKILTGSICPSVSGTGFKFFDEKPVDFRNPYAIEEKAKIAFPLNKEITDIILDTIISVI